MVYSIIANYLFIKCKTSHSVREYTCFDQSSAVKKAGVYKTAHLLQKLNADSVFRGFVVQSITSILLNALSKHYTEERIIQFLLEIS